MLIVPETTAESHMAFTKKRFAKGETRSAPEGNLCQMGSPFWSSSQVKLEDGLPFDVDLIQAIVTPLPITLSFGDACREFILAALSPFCSFVLHYFPRYLMVNYWVLLLHVGKTEQGNTSNPVLTIVNVLQAPPSMFISLNEQLAVWNHSQRGTDAWFSTWEIKKEKWGWELGFASWSSTGGLWGDYSAALLASVSQCMEGTLRMWQTPASFTSKTTVKAESGHDLPQKWSICEFIFPLNFNVEHFQHTQK